MVGPEDKREDEAMRDWENDPEILAAIERDALERDAESLKKLEHLFGPEGAKQFIEKVLGYPEGEQPWPETPGSRASRALGRVTLNPSLRKRLRYRGGDGTIHSLE